MQMTCVMCPDHQDMTRLQAVHRGQAHGYADGGGVIRLTHNFQNEFNCRLYMEAGQSGPLTIMLKTQSPHDLCTPNLHDSCKACKCGTSAGCTWRPNSTMQVNCILSFRHNTKATSSTAGCTWRPSSRGC